MKITEQVINDIIDDLRETLTEHVENMEEYAIRMKQLVF